MGVAWVLGGGGRLGGWGVGGGLVVRGGGWGRGGWGGDGWGGGGWGGGWGGGGSGGGVLGVGGGGGWRVWVVGQFVEWADGLHRCFHALSRVSPSNWFMVGRGSWQSPTLPLKREPFGATRSSAKNIFRVLRLSFATLAVPSTTFPSLEALLPLIGSAEMGMRIRIRKLGQA